MKTRNVRFEYYEVAFTETDSKGSKDALFDLVRWINKANTITSLKERTYDYYTEKVRLEIAYYDNELNYYFLHFVRLSDNIPSTGKLDGKVLPLDLEDDEYIGNEVSALYDENNHILMLQRNRSSLGPAGVEFYLNEIWDEESNTIYLRPIAPKGMFDNVKKADKFRRIQVRFADIDWKKLSENGPSPLLSILKDFGKYSGVAGEVIISSGRKKESSLDSAAMIETINDILANQETGLIDKAQVHYKFTDDTAVEIVDLFSKKAHDFGQFPMEKRTTLSHFAIAEKMWSIYHKANKKTKVLEYLLRE